MQTWITDFANEYKKLAGRYPAVYTAKNWWDACIGTGTDFSYMPLHLANYQGRPGGAGHWTNFDIWQYSDADRFAGDSNVFNGNMKGLELFTSDPAYVPLGATAAAEAKLAAEFGLATPVVDTKPAPVQAPAPVKAPAPQRYVLKGGIGTHYWSNGGEQRFGVPINNEFNIPGGGATQSFSSSYNIYWHGTIGAHSVRWGHRLWQCFCTEWF